METVGFVACATVAYVATLWYHWRMKHLYVKVIDGEDDTHSVEVSGTDAELVMRMAFEEEGGESPA